MLSSTTHQAAINDVTPMPSTSSSRGRSSNKQIGGGGGGPTSMHRGVDRQRGGRRERLEGQRLVRLAPFVWGKWMRTPTKTRWQLAAARLGQAPTTGRWGLGRAVMVREGPGGFQPRPWGGYLVSAAAFALTLQLLHEGGGSMKVSVRGTFHFVRVHRRLQVGWPPDGLNWRIGGMGHKTVWGIWAERCGTVQFARVWDGLEALSLPCCCSGRAGESGRSGTQGALALQCHGKGGTSLHGLREVGAGVQAAVKAGTVHGVRHRWHRGAVGLNARVRPGHRHPVPVHHLGQVTLARGHCAGLSHAQRQLPAFLVNLTNGGLVAFYLGG